MIDLRLSRSLLFVPGNRADRFAKAEAAGADGVIFDLEDAVAPAHRAEARATVLAHLAGAAPQAGCARIVRVNPVATLTGLDDLRALAASDAAFDAIMLPKIEEPAELRLVHAWLATKRPQLRLIALVETARAVEQAPAIAAGPALGALAFGGADLAAELGAVLAWESLAYQRGRVVTAAAGVAAIDMPYLDLADRNGFARECELARRMGFTGKLAIHPSQAPVINAAFTPTAAEQEHAQRVIAAGRAARGGVAVVEGKMVDAPIVRAAERVLALAARSNLSKP